MPIDLERIAQLGGELGLEVRRVPLDQVDLVLEPGVVLVFRNLSGSADSLAGFEGFGWHFHGELEYVDRRGRVVDLHGEERGLPFVMLTNRCTVGGEGVVGWAVPLAADLDTNPPSTPMLRVDSVAFNLIAWSALAALALRPLLRRSASHPATSRPAGPSSASP